MRFHQSPFSIVILRKNLLDIIDPARDVVSADLERLQRKYQDDPEYAPLLRQQSDLMDRMNAALKEREGSDES